MAALNFAALETAVAVWITAATGLTRVIRENDRVSQPDLPYATYDLSLPMVSGGGPDEVRESTDLLQPAGQEVNVQSVTHHELVLAVRFFSRDTVGEADGGGIFPARHYAHLLLQGVWPADLRGPLVAAGLVPYNIVGAVDLTERLGPVGQSRGIVELQCRLVASRDSRAGYISTVTTVPTIS